MPQMTFPGILPHILLSTVSACKGQDHYFKHFYYHVSFNGFVTPTSCHAKKHELGELLRYSKKASRIKNSH